MRWFAVLSMIWALALPAMAETIGGPVRAELTVAANPLKVDITWLQSGGVVMLKIETTDPVPAPERAVLLAAAEALVASRTDGRAAIATNGRLLLGLKLTGWNRSFTREDLASP